MNNLHRELAPVTDAAWAQIEEESRRTFTRDIGGRRVVDVTGPLGADVAAVGTGHLHDLDSQLSGRVRARARESQPMIELRAPFAVTRQAVDDVERGSQDSDWQPVKDAAKEIATAEDRMILHGFAPADITGIGPSSSNQTLTLPQDAREVPDLVAQGASQLRLAGVNGTYSLLLSADLYTTVAETTDHGYPILEHLSRLIDGDIIWAPAMEGALLVTTRGGDFELHLGQDLSIGYTSHDTDHVHLYLQETLTFTAYTAEASVRFSTR